jgi:hypothetical protein
MIMSRGIRREEHVARTGEKSNAYRIFEGEDRRKYATGKI